MYYNITLLSNTANIDALAKRLGEPEWILSWRKQQLAFAESLPIGEKYGIAIPALELKEEVNFSSYPEYHVEASKGLELYTWKEAMAQEEIAPMLERLMMSELLPKPASRDGAFGRANFQSGLVIYVQPSVGENGEYKEESLTLESTLALGAASDIIIVIVKEGARFTMKNIVKGGEDSSVLARMFVAILEGEAACTVESSMKEAHGFINAEYVGLVAAHSKCSWVEDPQSPVKLRSHTNSLLLGEGAESELLHVLIGQESAVYDIWAGTEHRASDTHSRIFALGLGTDTSKIIYRGAIDIRKGILRVDSAQEGKFLIAGEKAEIDAIPMLDIASKEVTSTHKLSISHIKDNDLFYAKTRGITEHDARELAVEGFFGSLLGGQGREELMNGVRERIKKVTSN
jgi:hypothetical protein